MTSSDESDEQSEASLEDANHDGQLRGRFRRDPYILLLGATRPVLRLLNALDARGSRLPGWVRLSAAVGTSVLSIYFGETIRLAIDGLVAAIADPVITRFVGTSFGTRVLVGLLLVVSFQVTVANYRLEWLMRTAGRKFETYRVEIVDNMESDAATDGGRGHSSEILNRVPRSWNGALTGIVAGVAIGMSFGVGGVVGGAILGAVVGDEIEKAALRRQARRLGPPP